MAEEPKREIRTCKTCGRELTSWKSPFCSDDCYAAYSGPTPDKPLPQAVKVLDEPKQPVSTKRQRANGKQALEPRVSKRGVINEGRPTKATPARIKAILGYIADNYTEAQACALAGIHPSNWIDWKKNTDRYPELRAKAEALWIRSKLKRKRELADKKLDWKEPAWDLERRFKDQFADPAKVALQLNQQINNLTLTEADLAETRRILDAAKTFPYRSGNGEAAHGTQEGKE